MQNITTKSLAEILDLTARQVRSLAAEGIFKRVGRGRFDLAECVQSYLKYKISKVINTGELGTERVRLLKIQADLKTLQLKKEEGTLINVEIAMRLWGQVIQQIRTRALYMPVKKPPLHFGLNSIVEHQGICNDCIRELLTECAEIDLGKKGTQKKSRKKSSRTPRKNNGKK